MKNLKDVISKLVYNSIKGSLLISAIIGLVFYLMWGLKVFTSFYIGFMIGCINFSLLSYGIYYMMSTKPVKAGFMQFITFTIRYLMIGIIFFILIKYKNANIFALTLGFLVIKISIVLRAFNKRPGFGGEAKDGRD